MDDRTRGRRRLPKGLILQEEAGTRKGKEVIQPREVIIPGRKRKYRMGFFSDSSSACSFLIGNAYNEPQGFDMVENIVLQRDYIID